LFKQTIIRWLCISEVVFSYPNVGLPSSINFGFRPICLLAGIFRYFLLSSLHSVTFIDFHFLRFDPSRMSSVNPVL